MDRSPTVDFDDLESALLWVSSAPPSGNSAFVSRLTGEIFHASLLHGTDVELPEDIDDASIYVAVPHKNDLDLGRELVFRFADEHLGADGDRVRGLFHGRGAYGRWRDLLERRGLLERWFAYERDATAAALREWARQNGITVVAHQPPR